jgi:serine/threonine-protein kinase
VKITSVNRWDKFFGITYCLRSSYFLGGLLLLSLMAGCGQTTNIQSPTSPQKETTAELATTNAIVWKTIVGNGVELSLPESYVGGNPNARQDLEAIAQKLKTIDPKYEKTIEALKKNSSAIALLAFDAQNDKSKFVTNVNVTQEQLPAGTKIEQYLDHAVKQLSTRFHVVDQKVVSLEKYQAGRVVAESISGEIPLKNLYYVIQSGNDFWLVTYATTQGEFDRRLPNFEESIRTFNLPSSNASFIDRLRG